MRVDHAGFGVVLGEKKKVYMRVCVYMCVDGYMHVCVKCRHRCVYMYVASAASVQQCTLSLCSTPCPLCVRVCLFG